MTTEELYKLADEHALALEYTPMSTYHSQRKSYEAGFRKALELAATCENTRKVLDLLHLLYND